MHGKSLGFLFVLWSGRSWEIEDNGRIAWQLSTCSVSYAMAMMRITIICFFGCSFSSSIWLDISSRAQIGWKVGNWSRALARYCGRCSNKNNPRHELVGLALASSIYHIWKERNNRIFDQHFSNSQKIRDDIVNSVCGKLGGLGVGDMVPSSFLQRWTL
ncbi:hypothetical protein OIU85_024519 [Salix viminalis]|uniref:Reverse transcriptase zinc-binding domain-containing protein n=1 Tax=Salix viminalis TaxID=40686 RepID=A0A9Q0Z4V9_SALVM|nr:hypothetical protein OIU85_024519 [Salix viminalis]